MVFTSFKFYNTLKNNFVCSLIFIHTLYILWSVFYVCASRLLMRCIYSKKNGKMCFIWLYYSNQTKIYQSLFWNMIYTYRTNECQKCLHFYQLEHLLYTNQVLLTLRNMHLAGHTGDDSNFRFGISSKFKPRKHIDLHMRCHFESTLF
jgi:hypothetical protein